MKKNNKTILDKFSTRLKKALLTAIKIAKSGNGKKVSTDHVIQALYFQEGSIAAEILRKANLKPNVFGKNMPVGKTQATPATPESIVEPEKQLSEKEMTNLGKLFKFIQNSKEGNSKTKLSLSKTLEKCILKAVLIAKKYNHTFIGTEHLLLAILDNPDSDVNKLFKKANVESEFIKEQVKNVLLSTAKFTDMALMFNLNKKKGGKEEEALEFFCIDLTKKKKAENVDPVIGRQKEIDRMINVLGRRNKNNVLLVGEPGVGKTAIVKGLARKISSGDVPPILRNKRILQLDLAKIIAGTMFRGEFEGRLKNLIEEAEKNPNVIIFIDELHSIVGLGNAQGSMDATNILKPALASGDFQSIGVTTFDEYKKHIENDPAFERRFQIVKVSEPEVDEAIDILMGVKEYYENYHNVKITPETIKAAAKFADRYITDRQLPDKALDILDEASARKNIAMADGELYQKIEDKRKKKQAAGKAKKKAVLNEKFEEALTLQAQEQTLEKEISTLRKKETRAKKDWPLITESDIGTVIEEMTGIPVEKILKKEKAKLLNLEKILKEKIVGQQEAVDAIAKFTRLARSGLSSPTRPMGSFMFLGPTGTGKTELAKVIAREVFENEDSLIRIDMSEFSEKFNSSKLIGAPAGYVGFEEGGKLTEAVRQKPYSVVLFDEIEKAHPDIFNLLLQILDEGHITDASGKKINFKNTIIIMTSNTGSKSILEEELGFKDEQDPEKAMEQDYLVYQEKIQKDLKETFRPEFLNRIDRIIIFKPLNQESIGKIVDLHLSELKNRLKEEKQLNLVVENEVKKEIVKRGFDPERGARPLRKAIQEIIEDSLAEKIISETITDGDSVTVSKGKKGFTVAKSSKSSIN